MFAAHRRPGKRTVRSSRGSFLWGSSTLTTFMSEMRPSACRAEAAKLALRATINSRSPGRSRRPVEHPRRQAIQNRIAPHSSRSPMPTVFSGLGGFE
jgi:hypothetical protein